MMCHGNRHLHLPALRVVAEDEPREPAERSVPRGVEIAVDDGLGHEMGFVPPDLVVGTRSDDGVDGLFVATHDRGTEPTPLEVQHAVTFTARPPRLVSL